jgi:hypothetical protein
MDFALHVTGNSEYVVEGLAIHIGICTANRAF